MDCSTVIESPYKLLFRGATMIPLSHYMLGFVFVCFVFLYNFLESHFLEDLLTRFRGSPVSLTYNPCSEIYQSVASKCKVIHGRYLATPWLSSPHLQTTFLSFYGNPPPVTYRRALFHASDGGTLALDWLIGFDVLEDTIYKNNVISKDGTTPIVVVIPGLTSDSSNAYIKHLAFNVAKHGWNVVVSNHRGLGGISVTSDCFYNAGWTEDLREVFKYLHHEYPKAPLFAVGTSIGANILVKYLGEDGENVPVAGAAAICSPWDLLIGDRFIGRRLIQKLYDRVLTIGLKGYAKLHQPRYSRLADWEGINKSRSIRDFDSYATCIVGKFETPDTYYRRCSSSSYVGNVSVPLLCISAFDDPVCTREAIPWDECRWVRATYEFLSVLHSSPLMHIQKKARSPCPHSSLESPIDQGPYLNVSDGLVAAMGNEQTKNDPEAHQIHIRSSKGVYDTNQGEFKTEGSSDSTSETAESNRQVARVGDGKTPDAISPIRRCLDELFQQSRRSMWLLTFIAITSSLPLVGTVLGLVLKKNIRKGVPAKLHKT